VSLRQDVIVFAGALGVLAASISLYRELLHVANPLIIGFTFLLIVLPAAAMARLWVPAAVSVVAMLSFNFFFLPPVGTLSLEDPQNWVALFVFLTVSLVASNLSTSARRQAREAIGRQHELARLFDVSRDALSPLESGDPLTELARCIADRFSLDYAAICLQESASGRSELHEASSTVPGGDRDMQRVPLSMKTPRAGYLALVGRGIEPAMLDALAGVVALAIERARFLDERNAAELARKSEELKSTLLASISHDLKTPLTAIRVAAGNLQASWLNDADRREQSDVIVAEVARLQRLFQNIVEMARIDAGAVAPTTEWVHPSEVVEAARDLAQAPLREHPLAIEVDSDAIVEIDPRLTATALAHVLENAAQYSPPGTTIALKVDVSDEGLMMCVRDCGPGIAETDLPHLFERFYRGVDARQRAHGTGMGLAIARGLLAAEHGRIEGRNAEQGGAEFTLTVPGRFRIATVAAES